MRKLATREQISYSLINMFLGEATRLEREHKLEEAIMCVRNAVCIRRLAPSSRITLNQIIREMSDEIRTGKKV